MLSPCILHLLTIHPPYIGSTILGGIAALDLSFRQCHSNGVVFTIPGLTKSRRSSPLIQAFYQTFAPDPKLCPVQILKAYEDRS